MALHMMRSVVWNGWMDPLFTKIRFCETSTLSQRLTTSDVLSEDLRIIETIAFVHCAGT